MQKELSLKNDKFREPFYEKSTVGVVFDTRYQSSDLSVRTACLTVRCLHVCNKMQRKISDSYPEAKKCLSLWRITTEQSDKKVLGNSFMYAVGKGVFVEVISLGLEDINDRDKTFDTKEGIIGYIAQYYKELAKMLHAKGCEVSFFPIALPLYDLKVDIGRKIRINSKEYDMKEILIMSLKGSLIGLLDSLYNYPDMEFIICSHKEE